MMNYQVAKVMINFMVRQVLITYMAGTAMILSGVMKIMIDFIDKKITII